MSTLCCPHELYLRNEVTLLGRLISISLQWDIPIVPPCAKARCRTGAQELSRVGLQSLSLPVHWVFAVPTNKDWKPGKAEQETCRGLETPSFHCRPKCLRVGLHRGAGEVHAQGGNSQAPTTYYWRNLFAEHMWERKCLSRVLVTVAGSQCDVESFCAQWGDLERVSFVFVEVINKTLVMVALPATCLFLIGDCFPVAAA